LKERYGLSEIFKLNWNEDLFGPFDGVLQAVEAELENAWMYPEQLYADFRAAVAGWIGTTPERIVPAHGIQALVTMVAAAFVRPGERVVIAEPTYGLYAPVCAAAGAPLPSQANFLLVRMGADDVALTDLLLRRGFLIRAGSEFGLRGYGRITVGPPELMERVAAELSRIRDELLGTEARR
jgi:histidinol-phosphate/aromatic aminotransferase/cobyric acid decarboxylase-like protein